VRLLRGLPPIGTWDTDGKVIDVEATELEQAGGAEDWRIVGTGASAWFDAPSQTAGAALVGRIAELSDGNSCRMWICVPAGCVCGSVILGA